MSIFDLFRRKVPHAVERRAPVLHPDVEVLLTLDAFARSQLASELASLTLQDLGALRDNGISTFLTKLKDDDSLKDELYVCALTTAQGKPINAVAWSALSPDRAVDCLGLLATSRLPRCDDPPGLEKSGYSCDPDEAQMQFLVLAANTLGYSDFSSLIQFAEGDFGMAWRRLRRGLFATNSEELRGERSLQREVGRLFEALNPACRQIATGLSQSLAQKAIKTTEVASSVKPPFDLEKHKAEHPLLYVPFPRLVSLMRALQPEIVSWVRNLPISEYEFRRLIGAKDRLTPIHLHRLIGSDANVFAYAIVVAAAFAREEKFIGCGVWKKVTEALQKDRYLDFQIMAEFAKSGTFSDPRLLDCPPSGVGSSLFLDQIGLARRAPSEFVKAAKHGDANDYRLLLEGTVVFRHVLNHPVHGKSFASFSELLLGQSRAALSEIVKGPLLSWDEQKALPFPSE